LAIHDKEIDQLLNDNSKAIENLFLKAIEVGQAKG
jgi:hypothetical protein